jgi:site-specific DNA recombinase
LIYTRKSSEEGLEQAFNSLDAQREASHAGVARSRCRGVISAVEPDEPASIFQQRDNAVL